MTTIFVPAQCNLIQSLFSPMTITLILLILFCEETISKKDVGTYLTKKEGSSSIGRTNGGCNPQRKLKPTQCHQWRTDIDITSNGISFDKKIKFYLCNKYVYF